MALGERGIATWWGNFYAVGPIERLGLEPEGVLRIGLTHYNTAAEVDRLVGRAARDRHRRRRRLRAASMSARAPAPDVAIVGGGIVGTALAAELAGRGVGVRAVRATRDRRGRLGTQLRRGLVSGRPRPRRAVPRDPRALPRARRRGPVGAPGRGAGARLPPRRPARPGSSPSAGTRRRLRAQAAAIAAGNPDFRAAYVGPDDLRRLEPGLADGLAGVRLDIGFPVAPAAACRAFAALAGPPRRPGPRRAWRRRSSVRGRRRRRRHRRRRRAPGRRGRGGRAVDPRRSSTRPGPGARSCRSGA